MSKPVFDSFCYFNNIVELSEALLPDKSDLLPIYDKDYLLCPGCGEARLKFTRKTTLRKAFLSTIPDSPTKPNNHLDGCLYSYDKATKKQVKSFYSALTKNQIQDKLNAAINVYLRNTKAKKKNVIVPAEHPSLMSKNEGDAVTYRQLPKRSIFSIYNISDEELNVPILLYGKVRLNVQKSAKSNGYRLLICGNKGNKYYGFYRFSEDDVDTETLYYVAIIAVFWKNEEGRLYSNLYNQDSIKYIPV